MGIEQFNRGRFFACHEVLETLWTAAPQPARQFYQGILQIGVAFYHLQAGRYRPAASLLERGSGYLRPFAPTYMGVHVARLLADVACCLAEVRRLGPAGIGDFDWSLVPKIKVHIQHPIPSIKNEKRIEGTSLRRPGRHGRGDDARL